MPSTSWGSARWATTHEVRRARLLRGSGVVLGRWEPHWFSRARYLRFGGGGHVLICSPPQPKVAGKTRALIVPTLLSWPGSTIVLDVKGELHEMTSGYRARLGPVYRVDTRDFSDERIDPSDLARWKTGKEVGDLQQLMEHLSSPSAPPTAVTEYWRAQASDVLVTGFLYLATQRVYRRSFGGLRRFMMDPQETMVAQVTKWRQCPDPHVREGAQRLMTMPPGDRAKVWDSAIRLLSLWRDPMVEHNTDTTTVPIQTFQHGPAPQSLYLQFTAEELDGRLKQLSRLWWQAILSCLTTRDVDAYRWPLLIVLDEFASMGYVPTIEKLFAVSAGYGIWGMAAVQSLDQLYAAYGEHTSILNNCAIRVFFAQNDRRSAETISVLLGQTTVTDTATRGPWIVQRGWTESTHSRPLLTPAEILDFPSHQGILRVPDTYPIRFTKIRPWRDWPFSRRLLPPHRSVPWQGHGVSTGASLQALMAQQNVVRWRRRH